MPNFHFFYFCLKFYKVNYYLFFAFLIKMYSKDKFISFHSKILLKIHSKILLKMNKIKNILEKNNINKDSQPSNHLKTYTKTSVSK